MSSDQLNVEFFFRLIYECLTGGCYGGVRTAELSAFLAHLWLWIIVVGYIIAVIALFVVVYATMRLFELRKREEEYYHTLILPPRTENGEHPRWEHITELASSTSESEWREAIIEADILLDEVLTVHGYAGANLGEKLKSADSLNFATLQDAWEAHKVRNQIAHQGSAFKLSETIVKRTIQHYEKVFREFKLIK